MSVLELANQHMLSRVPVPAKTPVFGTGNFKRKVVSESMAVHPDQIEEARAHDKKLGLTSVHYDEHGRPSFSDSGTFRKYIRAHGLRHKGYV